MSTVLLVEDSLTEADCIKRSLQSAGLTVFNAHSSEEAQTWLIRQRPDLIVLDVILPGQSGFELCREIRENNSTDSIPIVMYTHKETQADRMWGQMLGANAYLGKTSQPTEPGSEQHSELLATVRQLLRQ
jgi:two-component system, chemotaxis family, response regulator PixH